MLTPTQMIDSYQIRVQADAAFPEKYENYRTSAEFKGLERVLNFNAVVGPHMHFFYVVKLLFFTFFS